MAFSLTPPSILNNTIFKPMKMQFNRSSPSFSRYRVLRLIQMLEHCKNRHIQRKFRIWCLDKKMRDDSRSGTRCECIPNGKRAVKGRVQRHATACYKNAVISNGQAKHELFWRYFCSYLTISMAQSIIRDRLLYFCRSFWRVYIKSPLPFWRVAKYFEGNVKD